MSCSFVDEKQDVVMGMLVGTEDDFRVFEFVFHGREELEALSNEFDNLQQWTLKHEHSIGPGGTLYVAGPPLELIVLVVAFAANILAIADILYKRLADKGDSII